MTKQTEQTVIAEGFAFDPATRDWTKRIEFIARDRIEAVRWIAFQKDWLTRLRIVPAVPAALKTKGTFYTV